MTGKIRPLGNCIVCGRHEALRFSLIRNQRTPDGRTRNRGCGGIDLCEPCWAHATGRQKARKPRNPGRGRPIILGVDADATLGATRTPRAPQSFPVAVRRVG